MIFSLGFFQSLFVSKQTGKDQGQAAQRNPSLEMSVLSLLCHQMEATAGDRRQILCYQSLGLFVVQCFGNANQCEQKLSKHTRECVCAIHVLG